MIKTIGLKNFKCFLNSEVKLNQLTILAGSNAVGKSSLIHALLIIRQTHEQIKSKNIYTILKDNKINIENNQLIIENSTTDIQNNNFNLENKGYQNIAIPLTDDHSLSLGDTSQIISSDADSDYISFYINNQFLTKYYVEKGKHEIALKLDFWNKTQPSNKTSIFSKQFYYINAERLGPRVSQGMENQVYANTGIHGEYTGFALANNSEFKVNNERRIKEDKLTVPNLNKQVEYWLNLIIPGIEISTELYQEINRVGFYLKRTYSGTAPLNPNNVGFGISYVLPIIVSCLLAQKNSLIIVENPEAHLHPSGQSKIGQFLALMAASGLQIIVETHSDHLINGMRIAVQKGFIPNDKVSINFFSMSDKSIMPDIKHITLTEEADLSDWPDGFFDQEEKDLLTLFKGRTS